MSFMRVVESGDWEWFLGEDTSRGDHVSNRKAVVEMVDSWMKTSGVRTTRLESEESIYKVERARVGYINEVERRGSGE